MFSSCGLFWSPNSFSTQHKSCWRVRDSTAGPLRDPIFLYHPPFELGGFAIDLSLGRSFTPNPLMHIYSFVSFVCCLRNGHLQSTPRDFTHFSMFTAMDRVTEPPFPGFSPFDSIAGFNNPGYSFLLYNTTSHFGMMFFLNLPFRDSPPVF